MQREVPARPAGTDRIEEKVRKQRTRAAGEKTRYNRCAVFRRLNGALLSSTFSSMRIRASRPELEPSLLKGVRKVSL